MDLNDLHYFVLIVDHGGFTAAERVTHVHRSKLSRRIAQLEDELGVRLLQRSTRRLALTEAGRVFYDHCAAMVIEADAAREAVEHLRSEPVGTVRISCPAVMAQQFIAQLISDYMLANPKVRVELDSTDRTVNLIDDRIDIALRARGAAMETPGFVARRIGSGRFVLVASPSYLVDKEQVGSPEQLAQLDTVGSLLEGKEQVWSMVSAEGKTAKFIHHPRLLCSDFSVQYQAVVSGVGVALLPYRVVANGLKYGALIHLAQEWSTQDEGIHLVVATRRGLLPSVRSLIDYLVEHLGTAMGDDKPASE